MLPTSNTIHSVGNVTVCSTGDSSCNPYSMVYDTSNKLVYVADDDSSGGFGTVSVINGTSAVFEIHVGMYPQYMAYDPADKDIFVPISADNAIYVIDGKTNAVSKIIDLKSPSTGGYYPLFDPANNEVYVTDTVVSGNGAHSTGTISVINGTDYKIIDTIELPCYGTSSCDSTFMVYDPANQNVYVSEPDSSTGLYAINSKTNKVVASISVNGGMACGNGLEEDGYLIYNPANKDVFLECFLSGGGESSAVLAISSKTNTEIAPLAVGYEAFFMGYDNDSGAVYVNGFQALDGGSVNAGTVFIINEALNNVTAVVEQNTLGICCVSGAGGYLVYSPAHKDMYGVDSPASGLITVINSKSPPKLVSTLQTTHSGGMYGFDLYNPSNKYVYVAEGYEAGGIGVISVWS